MRFVHIRAIFKMSVYFRVLFLTLLSTVAVGQKVQGMNAFCAPILRFIYFHMNIINGSKLLAALLSTLSGCMIPKVLTERVSQ